MKIKPYRFFLLMTALVSAFFMIAASTLPESQLIQSEEMITAYGIIYPNDSSQSGPEFDFELNFPPAGGDVNGTGILQYSETDSSGNVVSLNFNLQFTGYFEGGDGGQVSGTVTGRGVATGYPDFLYSGTWNGTLNADGTGTGVYDATIRAEGYDTTQTGQFLWKVTFSADDFSAALNKQEVAPIIPSASQQPDVSPSDEEDSNSFDEAWNSKSAETIRNPLFPAIGGLIGTSLAWLLAKGAEGSQYLGNFISSNPSVIQPRAVSAAPPQPVTTPPPPPIITTEPPPLSQTTPPTVTPAGQESPWELGFKAIKDSIGGAATSVDLFKDYFTIADSPQTVQAIRDAMQAWHNAPSTSSAADYLNALKNSNSVRLENLNNSLKSVGKGLDAIDAGINAYKICQERGYTGWDAVLTVGAEYGKKFVVNTITSNPVAGLVDAAVGNSTQLIFGADNKIDLSVIVDKSTAAWDEVTQEAAQMYNSNFKEAADNFRAETLQGLTNKMKQLVSEGKISKQEGIKRLKHAIDTFNEETPKI